MEAVSILKDEKKADFLAVLILFFAVFLVNLPLAATELVSPDACAYLDIGRNLLSAKGAVTSYNLYQYWPGHYHPSLPYMQPLYAVVAGLIWILFSLKAVIGFNIFLSALNSVLLYKIIRLYQGCLVSFFISFFTAFSIIFTFSAIFPWTEHLHLLFLLAAIFIYLKYERFYFLIGAIFALSCLVRFAGLYSLFAFMAALVMLKGFSKQAFKGYLKITGGFLAVFLAYEAFCYFKYGVFYPEYLNVSTTYRLAELFPGAFYRPETPVLNMPRPSAGLGRILSNTGGHMRDFFGSFRHIKFLLIFLPFYAVYDFVKKRRALTAIFFLQGAMLIVCYSLSLWWLPEVEVDRYSLVPFIALGVVGFIFIKEVLDFFFSRKGKNPPPVFFVLIILPLIYSSGKDYLVFRKHYKDIYPYKYRNREDIYEVCAWLKANTKEDDLTASNFLGHAFLSQRPFVSLPSGKAFTSKNFRDFLKIYKPKYIYTQNTALISLLKTAGFKEKLRKGAVILLEAANAPISSGLIHKRPNGL